MKSEYWKSDCYFMKSFFLMESQFLVVSEASSHHISTLTCFLFVLGNLLMFSVCSKGVGF